MLRDFAEKHGMFQYEYYVDDGYTGRNFNRPSFQRMIADIEAGKIGCVITKDLSRLGRNYIEAGSYIEIFFPKHNVRYIAVTDGVDSLTRQEMDITPFKNILNDMYSRDISKKVLAGHMTRSRQGKFCGGQPPLGLMRDPEDKGHLILDPETALVIRKIYDMALDGWGCMRIAKQLMEDKIPITRVKSNTECDVNYYSWGSARISHILRNPFYKGAHLVCRTHQKGIRSNTYDIIPREDWEQVQEIIDRRPTIMKGNACPSITCSTGWSTAPPAGSPCRCGMKRSAEPARTVLPARCGSRLIRHTISARPTIGWARTPVPATRLRQGICTIWY